MSASTARQVVAVVGGPSGRHRHRTDLRASGPTGNTRENHCADGDSGAGREMSECRFGGLGGVHHADAGHRHDDLLAAHGAEIEVPPVDDHGGVRVECGAGENGVGLGRKGGQDQRALLGLDAVGAEGLTRRVACGRPGRRPHCGLELAPREGQHRPQRRHAGRGSRRADSGQRPQDRVDDARHHPAHDANHR